MNVACQGKDMAEHVISPRKFNRITMIDCSNIISNIHKKVNISIRENS